MGHREPAFQQEFKRANRDAFATWRFRAAPEAKRPSPRGPCIIIVIIPMLGPKVCKYYLHWAIWTPRVGKRTALNPKESKQFQSLRWNQFGIAIYMSARIYDSGKSHVAKNMETNLVLVRGLGIHISHITGEYGFIFFFILAITLQLKDPRVHLS